MGPIERFFAFIGSCVILFLGLFNPGFLFIGIISLFIVMIYPEKIKEESFIIERPRRQYLDEDHTKD